MLPMPPDLAGKVGEWTDAELFRIVKHGVRFTGMPAWPAQDRDDEVWAMVAFLRELPGMSETGWRNLAYDVEVPPVARTPDFDRALGECTRCHGNDGYGRSAATPVLAGQNEAYLLASLEAYAGGHRASGVMAIPVKSVDPGLLPGLARHFSALPPPAREPALDVALVERGEEIARRGVLSHDVPACLGCHGRRDRNPVYPALSGQPAEYVASQLKLFRSGMRGGTRYEHLMRNAARNLSDEEIEALAAYLAQMPQIAATGTAAPR
jgi:cytochrome c553